jgi:hypothetical protein
MENETSSVPEMTPPTAAVLPLDYFDQYRSSWQPAVRWVAWLLIATRSIQMLAYGVSIACYAWEQMVTVSSLQPKVLRGAPLLMGIPNLIATLIVFFGAIAALRFREAGRRWVVSGLLLSAICYLPMSICVATYYHFAYSQWRYGSPYETNAFVSMTIVGIAGSVFELFLWSFFRKPEVRAVFRHR